MTDNNAAIADKLEQSRTVYEQATSALAKLTSIYEDIVNTGRNDGQVTPATLGLSLFHIKEAHGELDDLVKKAYHAQDTLNKHLLPERLRENSMDGMRIPEIARSFSIIEKMSASFLDKEKGIEWLRATGQGDIVQETVNAGTLAAFCRNLILEQGIDPPADVVKVSTYSTIGMTKYRP